MNITRTLTGLGALLVLSTMLISCSTSPGEEALDTGAADSAAESEISPVVLLGDSISVGLSVPLTQAFAASGNRFRSLAAEGGGNVVGPFSEESWKELPELLEEADPGLVVYQVTTYDWGTEAEQRSAYERLVDVVSSLDAQLLFVTMPPIRADDFFEPHLEELERTTDVAAAVADASDGRAHLLDGTEVWGGDYQQMRDGIADRSSDGIHACPQGAARYAVWLLDEIAELNHDFTPAAPEEWANSGWSSDDSFVAC